MKQSSQSEFPLDEYKRRWEKLWSHMDDEGLAAMMVTDEPNYRYLTGHQTYGWISRSRPMIAVLPLGRQPITVTAELELEIIRQTSWIEDSRTYLGFDEEALATAVSVLRDLNLINKKVGVAYGAEMRLGMPVPIFERLKTTLRDTSFVDGTQAMWRVRTIKSSLEIEKIRRCCKATNDGLNQAFASIRAGMREREIHKRLHLQIIAAGTDDVPFLPVHSGRGNYSKFGMGPTDRSVERGDIVWADPAARVDGYYSDFSRMVAVERASDWQRSAFDKIREITEACVEATRPGVPISILVEVRDKAFVKLGYEQTGARSGRMGHASGLDMTEPPSVSDRDRTILQPGMVIHIEPKILGEEGAFVLEEIVAVTDGEPDRLTVPPPDHLPVVGT